MLCNIFLYICCCHFNQNNAKKNVLLFCVIFSCTIAVAISIKIMLKNFVLCYIFLLTFQSKKILKKTFFCDVLYFPVALSIKIILKNMFFVLCNIFLYICCCHFNQNNAKRMFYCVVLYFLLHLLLPFQSK